MRKETKLIFYTAIAVAKPLKYKLDQQASYIRKNKHKYNRSSDHNGVTLLLR